MGINLIFLYKDSMGVKYASNMATLGDNKEAEADGNGTMMGAHLGDWDDIKGMPFFPSGTGSLLAKCLTPDVWEACKDRRDKYGFSFKQAIFSGAKWTNSGVGVYAGSHDSYYAFAPLMDKIIERYHGHGKNDKHISSMDHTALNRAERLEIESLVTSALSEFTGDLAGKYYSLSKMSAGEKSSLINDHFLFKGGDKYLESCGLERDWPEARGIYHNNAKTFLVWVNEEDQLRIISM